MGNQSNSSNTWQELDLTGQAYTGGTFDSSHPNLTAIPSINYAPTNSTLPYLKGVISVLLPASALKSTTIYASVGNAYGYLILGGVTGYGYIITYSSFNYQYATNRYTSTSATASIQWNVNGIDTGASIPCNSNGTGITSASSNFYANFGGQGNIAITGSKHSCDW